jgi:hypothetical protein
MENVKYIIVTVCMELAQHLTGAVGKFHGMRLEFDVITIG